MKILCLLLCAASSIAQLQECDYDGTIYQTGDSFLDSEGCNHCFCRNGAVACTLMLCIPQGTRCTYGGVGYTSGATFNATDGCNTCQCIQGKISCTEMACLPQGLIPPL